MKRVKMLKENKKYIFLFVALVAISSIFIFTKWDSFQMSIPVNVCAEGYYRTSNGGCKVIPGCEVCLEHGVGCSCPCESYPPSCCKCVQNNENLKSPITIRLEWESELIDQQYPESKYTKHYNYPIVIWEDKSKPREGTYIITITNIGDAIQIFHKHIQTATGDLEYQVNPNYPIGGIMVDGVENPSKTLVTMRLTPGDYRVKVSYSLGEGYAYGASEVFTIRGEPKSRLAELRKAVIGCFDAPREVITQVLLKIFYPSMYNYTYGGCMPSDYVPMYQMLMPFWIYVLGGVLGYGIWVVLLVLIWSWISIYKYNR